jgi:hypothetical protein
MAEIYCLVSANTAISSTSARSRCRQVESTRLTTKFAIFCQNPKNSAHRPSARGRWASPRTTISKSCQRVFSVLCNRWVILISFCTLNRYKMINLYVMVNKIQLLQGQYWMTFTFTNGRTGVLGGGRIWIDICKYHLYDKNQKCLRNPNALRKFISELGTRNG